MEEAVTGNVTFPTSPGNVRMSLITMFSPEGRSVYTLNNIQTILSHTKIINNVFLLFSRMMLLSSLNGKYPTLFLSAKSF